MTKTYQISNSVSGAVLGDYEAADEMAALDVMAKDAGYQDYADLQSVSPDDDMIVVEI